MPAVKKGLIAAACSFAITGITPSFVDAAPVEAIKESRQPNVLLIFADDLGYADAGFQNQSKDVETPNLDRLAADGAILTAGYVTAPVSGPSRAGLMTGRYQQRFGYHDNIGPFVLEEDIVQGLPLDLKTMADYFKEAGYRTGMVGKWHDGDPKEYWPHNRGFEDFFGFNNGAANYWVGPRNLKKYKNKPYAAIYRNDELVPEFDEYLTDRFGTEAVNYIEKRKDDPFFLFVPFNAIHGPLQAKKEDLERFEHIEDVKRRTSVAMSYNMDQNIGRILDKLEEHDLMEDTIIFFLSDNGGKIEGNYSYNFPLRSEKGTLWDGGVRIPFSVTWRGTIPAGQTLDEPVISLDILTTSLAGAKIKQQEEWQLEGVNLLPYLKGEKTQLEDRFLFWENSRSSAIRDRDWKLIVPNKHHKNANPQLFNISEDIGEQNNLFRKHPGEVKRLQQAFDKWNADNEPSKWGWGRDLFPFTNGYRGRND
ncbi:sulfatase-like hydrolase/transferase [Endozoicomonas lisbonensis]|uniref:sulfatase-like hydrolase/transferase n=1 Tax=Endozoicomonas lisbonensis TaxID=3120522 RepID=UPI0033938B77